MRATKPQPGKDSGGPAHSHASDNSLRRVALPYPDFMPARGSRPRLHRLLDPAQAHRRRQAAPPTALARRSASARAISTRSRPRRASILSTLPPTSSSLLLPHSPWSRLDACAISSGARDERAGHHSPDRREGRRQRHRCVPKDLIRMREDGKTPSQRPLAAIPMRRTPPPTAGTSTSQSTRVPGPVRRADQDGRADSHPCNRRLRFVPVNVGDSIVIRIRRRARLDRRERAGHAAHHVLSVRRHRPNPR